MRTVLTIILAAFFSLAVYAQTTNPTSKSDADIVAEARNFQEMLVGALRKGDREALERMIGEGFVFIHSTGPIETRDEYIAGSARGNLMLQRTEIENFDVTWRVYGGDTVIRRQRTVMRNKAAGTENRMRNVAVFVKTAGKGWQWVSGQSTKLPVRPPAFAVDTAVYDDYAGKYEITPDRSFTVTKENGVLYGLTTGRLKSELIPQANGAFVLFNENNDPGFMEIVFARDSSGRTADAVLRLNNQEVWRAKRAK